MSSVLLPIFAPAAAASQPAWPAPTTIISYFGNMAAKVRSALPSHKYCTIRTFSIFPFQVKYRLVFFLYLIVQTHSYLEEI